MVYIVQIYSCKATKCVVKKINIVFFIKRHILSYSYSLFVANTYFMNNHELENPYSAKMRDLSLEVCLKIKDNFENQHSAYNLFCHFYGCIPQIETCYNLNCNRLIQKLRECYQEQIITQYYCRQYDIERDELIKTNFIILLTHEIAIHLNYLEQYVQILYSSTHISEVRSIWSKVREIHFTKLDCQNSK